MKNTLLLSLPAPQIWRARFAIFMLVVLGGLFISFRAIAIPLEIVSKSPASGSFPSGGRELSITLNKSVGLTLQPSKEIRVYRYSDDALLQTLDISHDNTNQIGDDIYFTLDEFLPHGVEVYVQLDYGAFVDFSADPDDYTPGILDDSWRFTVGSDRPEITDMSIISDNLAPVNIQLEITFDRSVVKSDEDGIEFGVYRKSDDFRVNGFDVVDVDLSTVTISSSSSFYGNLQSNTEYYVSMEEGYFVQHNSAVRAAEGVGQSNQYEWSFTTRVNDGNAPDLVSLSPANGDQRVARLAEDLEFTMTFDEPVYLGNTSSKAFLYRASDDVLIYNLGANASSSEDNLSVTFTTPNNLTTDTEYYILLDLTPGAFGLPYFDTDENSIPAISNSSQWAFKTYGSIQKTAYTPEIAADDASGNLVATLTTDAPLEWGDAGDVNLVNYIGSSVEKTIANGSGDVSFDGTSVTIDFGEVDYETHYYITFDNGAIVDEFDQSVTFTNKQWHFTTEAAPNVAPTNVELTSYDVNENSAVNTVVGFLFATDENAGDSHIYSLVSNPGDLFNISGYNLRVNGDLDFEASASHVIRVEADDQNGGTFEKDLTITVNNVVESPTDILLSNTSIDENNEEDALIGTLSTVDSDNGETHIYSLNINPGGTFYITNGNELRTNISFDFETTESYDIRILTDDQNGGSFLKDFTITVNDGSENVAPTDISLTATSIDENNADDAAIAGISATDADVGDTHIYTLLVNPDNSFSISGSLLYANASFDYETQSSYDIRIQAADQGNNTFEKDFTITINDVVESNNPTDITLSDNAFEETRQVGYTIGSFSTTDPDEGESYTYALVAGEGDTDNDNFSIVGSQLRVGTAFDFETQSEHSIRVQTDDGNTGTFEKIFLITVEDDPEVPTDITLDNSTITEDNSIGDVIGTLTTDDQDIGDTHSYSILTIGGSTDHTAFEIVDDELKAAVVFDFETQNSYTIRIRTQDAIGDSYVEDFVITIDDGVEANTAPTDITLSPNDLDENSIMNTIVGSFSATDPDAGDSHTFSLVAGDGSEDNGSFFISGDDLRVGPDPEFDYETKATYFIRVRANDGNGGLFEKELTVTVNDVNENQAPTAVNLTPSSINENNVPTATIGTLTTVDPDEGDTHTYTLQNFLAIFTIEGDQLKADIAFDYEDQDSYTINIQTDDGNGGTYTQSVEITINDVEEDVTGPEIVSFDPTDNATNVALDEDLIVTFDEPILASSGTVRVALVSSGTIIINGSPHDGSDQFTVDGSTLTIHMGAEDRVRDFNAASEYYVEIYNSAVVDFNANPFDMGWDHTDQTTWSFTTVKGTPEIVLDAIADKMTDDEDFVVSATSDNAQTSIVYSIVSGPATISGQTVSLTGATGTVTVQASQVETAGFVAGSVTTTFDVSDTPDVNGPQIVSFTPEDDADEVPKGSDLTVTFNEPVQFGNGFIQVIRAGGSGQQVISAAGNSGQDVLSIDGSALTIHLGGEDRIRDLFFGAEYYVTINTSAIRDLAGNNLETGISNTTDWSFTAERETITWSAGAWSNGTGPSNVKNAIIDDDFSVEEDRGYSLLVADLTINAGFTLTVDGDNTLSVYGDLTNNGSLTVESGSSLITYEGNTISDNITIQRNTRYADGKYSFVGTPVEEDANITGADLGSHVYRYDEGASADENDLARWQDASLDALVPGRGYTQANQQLIEFVGKPNSGTITYGGSHSTDGWHLVSNPYPAAIHIDDFIDGNEDITGSVYIWDDNGSDVSRGLNSDYIAANKMGATDSHGVDSEARFNDHLGSMQGFFVQLDGFSGLVNFTEEMRVSGQNDDNNFFRQVDVDDVSRIRVNLTNGEGLFRQTMIGWGSAFSDTEFVKGYDAELFRSGTYQIYSMKEDIPLSIQAASTERKQVALGLKIEKSGMYSLEIDTREYSGEEVFIHDLIAGRYISAADGPYQFMANGGQLTNRFELVVKSAVLGVQSNLAEVYASGKTLYIKTKDTMIKDYQIFNLLGVEVMTIQASGSSEIYLNDLSNGVYIVSDGIESKKIILK
ncbi:MAG: Ig-like domain-containing protein [Cyclobacteriaceae bacterium]